MDFLEGSYFEDLESRVGGSSLTDSVSDLESRIDDFCEPVGAAGERLTENYNIVTTLLSNLVGAVNKTNKRVNEHDDIFKAKGWLT